MWQALLWRVVAWFTWSHIQWLMVKCLGNSGLEEAVREASIRASVDKKYSHKTWDSITVAELIETLDRK
jgi:uncharacterized protein CbrC (UPF0167 family)